MPDSIKKQMADIAKQYGFTDPIVIVESSSSGVIVSVAGSLDPLRGQEAVEQAQVGIKEFLERE